MREITPEYIEQIRRRQQQLLRVAHTLRRSKLDIMAMVLYQVSDDISALIGAKEKDGDK